jgi:DNA-binding MarR family transcriptional regulator
MNSLASSQMRRGDQSAMRPVLDAIRQRYARSLENAAALSQGMPLDQVIFFKEQSTLPSFEEKELHDPQLLACAAAEIYRMRRARDQILPDDLVGEPAWDILLALFAEEPAQVSVSSLCYASGVPATTALRWINVLSQRGMIERVQHPRDGRVVLVSLTESGRLSVGRALQSMLRAAGR